MKIAVYPGTFNPITNGHMDLAERAAGLFDKIIVAVVSKNQQKPNALSLEQRMQLTKKVLGHLENVEFFSFDILITLFLKEFVANIILRGLRTVAYFQYDFYVAVTLVYSLWTLLTT